MLQRTVTNQAELNMDWRAPRRATTPDGKAASLEAFRSSPAVKREYQRGLLHGWIGAMAFYAIATAVLVLAFHALGVHP